MKKPIATAILALFALQAHQSFADISLFEFDFNIDGAIPPDPTSVPGLNLSGFDASGTGLGDITFTLTGAGGHNLLSFFDHEIDEADNGFSNELGSVSGVPAAGQSWEIDEPGFEPPPGTPGDI